MSLTFREFAEANRQRAPVIQKGVQWDAMDWAGCMAGEAGEAVNWAAKLRRMEEDIDPNDPSRAIQIVDEFAKELADTVTYAFLAAESLGIDLETICIYKFNEVSMRRGLPHRMGTPDVGSR